MIVSCIEGAPISPLWLLALLLQTLAKSSRHFACAFWLFLQGEALASDTLGLGKRGALLVCEDDVVVLQ